ncbi:MAG: hypothetical protein AB1635_08090 [Acidobacteriota bacterium]
MRAALSTALLVASALGAAAGEPPKKAPPAQPKPAAATSAPPAKPATAARGPLVEVVPATTAPPPASRPASRPATRVRRPAPPPAAPAWTLPVDVHLSWDVRIDPRMAEARERLGVRLDWTTRRQ